MMSTFALFAADEKNTVMEPDENTAAFWDLSLLKNGAIEDQSGFGNLVKLGSLEKAPLPSVTADGLRFDNKGGFAEVYGKESLRILKSDFSIDVVFKSDSAEFLKKAQSAFLIGNKSFSEKTGFSLSLSNWQKPHFAFAYAQDGKPLVFDGAFPAGTLKAGVFHHVQVSRSGGKLTLFLDGVKLAEKEISGDISLVNPRRIRLGIYPAPWQRDKDGKLILSGLDGVIRFVRISDKGRNGK
jgi:hypothetical protein